MRRGGRLPRSLAADLDFAAEGGVEVVEDFSLLRNKIGFFEGVELEVVEFERGEWAVLKQFPVAAAEGINSFAAVGRTAFAADEIEIAGGLGIVFTEERRQKTGAVDVRGRADAEEFAGRGEDVHGQGHAVRGAAERDVAGPAGGAGNAQAAFVHVP